ncbi:MAG: copper chaperone PCu(A)C [Stellaceae bacterium]
MIRMLLGLMLAVALGASAMAAESEIALTNAWARATPGGARTGAAYVTITNKGKAPDRLVSATTPVAGMAELHTTIEANGVSQMRPVKSLEIKPGESVTLKPGGMHLMLMRLKGPLKQGETFPLALTFAKAGQIETAAKVAKIGAMSDEDAMHGMDMK